MELPLELLQPPPRLTRYPSIKVERRKGALMCPVCFEDEFTMYHLIGKGNTCGHMLCGACLKQYLPPEKHSLSCPMCRRKIHRRNLREIRC